MFAFHCYSVGIPTTSSNTVNLPQRQEPLNSEEDSSVRALYTAFMPQHLQVKIMVDDNSNKFNYCLYFNNDT